MSKLLKNKHCMNDSCQLFSSIQHDNKQILCFRMSISEAVVEGEAIESDDSDVEFSAQYKKSKVKKCVRGIEKGMHCNGLSIIVVWARIRRSSRWYSV